MADAEMSDGVGGVAELTSALEQARSELTRLEVEHESALNALHRQVAAAEDKARSAEEERLKEKVAAGKKGDQVKALEGEVEKWKKEATEGSGRDDQAKKRLAEVEKEKRDLLGVIEEKERDNAELTGAYIPPTSADVAKSSRSTLEQPTLPPAARRSPAMRLPSGTSRSRSPPSPNPSGPCGSGCSRSSSNSTWQSRVGSSLKKSSTRARRNGKRAGPKA